LGKRVANLQRTFNNAQNILKILFILFRRAPVAAFFFYNLLVVQVQAEQIIWHDLKEFTIEGKGWSETKDFYDRLPAKAEKTVRPAVWNLSRDSAGICARFITDAPNISARWKLRKESLAMPHMPASGVSGLDLYAKEKNKWLWVGAAQPKNFPTNEATLVDGIAVHGGREFLIYLPLYNGVTSVEIGVPAGTKIRAAMPRLQKPIVFYGTSILQGGCASRPGMAYPAIIGRKLDWPTINLGFSGNAKSEPEIAQLLTELDPAVYVLDPVPNMDAALIRERMEFFVRTVRNSHPKIPIFLVESLAYTDGALVPKRKERYSSSNAALRDVFSKLKNSGVKNLHYVSGENLIGDDHEATVDGTHPTDLGFVRIAEKLEPVLRKFVK
jgi:hypothetical protein